MARITLAGRSSIPTTDLDANFTELYSLLGNPASSTTNIGIGTGAGTARLTVQAATGQPITSLFQGQGGNSVQLYIECNESLLYTAIGSSGAASRPFLIKIGNTEVARWDVAGVLQPGADNTTPLGASGKRWSVVYAGTGTINTSDAREKTGVQPLTDAEIAAAKQLAGEIGSFCFLNAVAAKGNNARLHIGLTVQRAIELMQAHGLDPLAYGFICHDAWTAQDNQPAGDRYGFRTDELLLFLARGFDARLQALEARA